LPKKISSFTTNLANNAHNLRDVKYNTNRKYRINQRLNQPIN